MDSRLWCIPLDHNKAAQPTGVQRYTKGVSMVDGNKILTTHIGSTQLYASNITFQVFDTLCAPAIK